MVQRKEVNNKHLGIKTTTTNNSLTIEKRQTNTKHTLQNHDTNSKVADFKAIKMKKSRSIKRSDSEISQRVSSKSHVGPRQPGKPPPLLTPRCKKTSPNYMKSTRSSEARREKPTQTTKTTKTILSTSKVHKVVKTLTKTCSFKKIRTLTKVTSFKPIKISTCSSTLKDSKFPPYLELKPGSTEAQGKSKLRVCSYNHCSLNDQPRNSTPPLKRFISLRRLQLKSHKVNRPEILSPRKRTPSESKIVNPIEDFLVDFFVKDKEVDTQVSERLSDGPHSEIDSMDNLDQNEDAESSEMNFISKKGYSLSSVQNKASFESSDLEAENSPSLSSEFCENSDIEWEEGKTYTTSYNGEILNQSHCSNDQDKPDFENEMGFGEYLEEFDQYPPYFQDEIVEFVCFSDGDSLIGSESTHTAGKENIEGPAMDEKNELNSAVNNEVPEGNSTPIIEATTHVPDFEDKSDVKQEGNFLNLIEEVTEAQNEDLKSKESLEFDGDRSKKDNVSNFVEEIAQDQNENLNSYEDSLEIDGDRPNEENYMPGEIREENEADFIKEEREPIEETINNTPQISENSEILNTKRETCKGSNDGQNNSSEVKLRSHEDNVVEEKTSEIGENHSTEVDEIIETINKSQKPTKCISKSSESYSKQELLESSNKLKRVVRSKKEDEETEEEREFNPRGPNFLDLEADPDAEKVDLRHQEMDDRRNAEEWLLDYALQKRVNELTLARKKKVDLLVEAFETVLPISKYEY